MSLISICQDAASQLGLAQPSVISGSSDLTAQLLMRYAQQAGKELSKYHDWQNLIVEKTFTSVATQVQTASLPTSDYDRLPLNVELWNRSLNLRYVGPTPQRTWQRLKSGVAAGAIGYWRILGNQINIYPVPTAGQTLAYEYISKKWCQSAGGTGQALWMADTDVANIPEDILTLEIVWRFRAGRGFGQYAEDMDTCEREKEKAASRDRGSGRIRGGAGGSDWPPQPTWSGTVTT